VFMLEGIISCVAFCLPYNVIVGNVVVFMLEVNQAYDRYLPPYDVVF